MQAAWRSFDARATALAAFGPPPADRDDLAACLGPLANGRRISRPRGPAGATPSRRPWRRRGLGRRIRVGDRRAVRGGRDRVGRPGRRTRGSRRSRSSRPARPSTARGAAGAGRSAAGGAGRSRTRRPGRPRRWPSTCGPTTSSAGCWPRRSTRSSTAPRGSCASCPAASTTWATRRASSTSSTTTTPALRRPRAYAVRRRDVPGVAGPRAGAVRTARRPVHDRGQPGVDRARRGLRHARRGHARHGRRDAGEPGRARRPDGRRGHARGRARRPDAGPLRGQQGRAHRLTSCGSADCACGCPSTLGIRRYGVGVRDAGDDGPAESQHAARRHRRRDAGRRVAPDRRRRRHAAPPDVVLLVDGVRRIDADVWLDERGRQSYPGLAASYAAGVVRCDLRGAAWPSWPTPDRARPVHAPARPRPRSARRSAVRGATRSSGAGRRSWSTAVQATLTALEESTCPQADRDRTGDLLVVDGPLRSRRQLPRT